MSTGYIKGIIRKYIDEKREISILGWKYRVVMSYMFDGEGKRKLGDNERVMIEWRDKV